MKIRDVQAIPIRVPLRQQFDAATYAITERCTIVVEVHTDDGPSGRIFIGDNRDQQDAVVTLIHDRLRPVLIGEDPVCVERCWQQMFQLTRSLGNRPLLCSAIAAVDAALWDLAGKVCGQPVYKLVGGCRDAARPIIIAGYYAPGKDLAALRDEFEGIKAQGFAGAKVKVGGVSPQEDARRIEAIRAAVGDDFIIACDANQGWDRFEAVEFGLAVKPLGIAWFEEPVQWHDYVPGMRFVREQTGLSVTAGQSDFFHDACRTMIEQRAVDIINHDISGGSGITDWLKIARMAELYQVRMAHHEDPLLAMHLLAGVPLGLYPEYFSVERDPLTPDIVVEQPAIRDGWVRLGQEPGFGLAFNEDFIGRYRVDRT
ncbi:mandelate racemase/muconate lactonizing enzyme family protein [Saccharopolyspora sp. 5N708]|uniref:mandelate racemase/muconate lactonizing enzyme family protein n=1 Tax=Saccharopolyspora sp. 5N708 TaxID=3457424 RepID=UPI003FCF922A